MDYKPSLYFASRSDFVAVLFQPGTPGTNRPIESHSGARGNILVGPPNIFAGPFWEAISDFLHARASI